MVQFSVVVKQPLATEQLRCTSFLLGHVYCVNGQQTSRSQRIVVELPEGWYNSGENGGLVYVGDVFVARDRNGLGASARCEAAIASLLESPGWAIQLVPG